MPSIPGDRTADLRSCFGAQMVLLHRDPHSIYLLGKRTWEIKLLRSDVRDGGGILLFRADPLGSPSVE